jgi:hypothetical protein
MSFLVGIVTVAGRTAFSPLGRRLACVQQMSYSGRNFDILTGVTAIAVAAFTFSAVRVAAGRDDRERARGTPRGVPCRFAALDATRG